VQKKCQNKLKISANINHTCTLIQKLQNSIKILKNGSKCDKRLLMQKAGKCFSINLIIGLRALAQNSL
jgi:hypothetical protein